MEPLHPRVPEIVADPRVRGGAPCFSGTRIPVSTVLHWLSEGWGPERILAEYPQLTPDDIAAGLRFAAERVAAAAIAAA